MHLRMEFDSGVGPTCFPIIFYDIKNFPRVFYIFLLYLFQVPYFTWRDPCRCQQNSNDCRVARHQGWGRPQSPYFQDALTSWQLQQCRSGQEQLSWDHLGLFQLGGCYVHFLRGTNSTNSTNSNGLQQIIYANLVFQSPLDSNGLQ